MLLRGFEWPENLPEDISQLPNRSGINTTTNEFFDAVIDRLTDKFMKSAPKARKTKKTKESHPLRPLKWLITSISIIVIIAILAVTALAIIAIVTNPDSSKTFFETVNDFWEDIKKSIETAINEHDDKPEPPDFVPDINFIGFRFLLK